MSILSIIEATGHVYRKKATTRGGEYSGPCPWCGGSDRFSIHPEQDHYVCRQCKQAGNSISFMMKYHNQHYFEACENLQINPKWERNTPNTATEQPGENKIVWAPREIVLPPDLWSQKAGALLFSAYKYLLSAAGTKHRAWLNDRGISNATIKQARMGWIDHSASFDRTAWGLPSETDQSGKNRQIWVPGGLILPQFQNNRVIRLRVRLSDPDAMQRFVMVSGSAMGFFDYDQHLGVDLNTDRPAIITEAELDGWLLQQELSGLCRVYAVGNASARPDRATHQYLTHHKILLNLDNDKAGRAEVGWWMDQYPHTLPYFSSMAKDPGDDYEIGVDIRMWGKVGMDKLLSVPRPPKNREEHSGKSFKSTLLSQIPKPEEGISSGISEKAHPEKHTPQKPKKIMPQEKLCVHNKYCQSMKNGQCLVSNKVPYVDMVCPRGQWYPYTTGSITEIILGPGMAK